MPITPITPSGSNAPNDLPSDAAGAVAVPNTLPSDAAGAVAVPNTLPADGAGSVASPVSLPSVAAAAAPRTLTPMVNLDFAAKSYARKGRTVLFDDLLTYTRPSSATFINRRIDVDGGYEYFLDTDYVGDVTNLLTYSEDFSNADWSKIIGGSGVQPTVSANKSLAPDGSLSADTITFNAGGSGGANLSYVQQFVSVQTSLTASVWLKSQSGNTQVLLRSGGTDTAITLTSEWVRYTSLASVNFDRLAIIIRGDLTGANDVVLDVFGAQLTASTKPLPYVKTLASAVTQTFTETLRVEYDAATGENLGALIEGGSTNLALYSEDFSNAAWENLNCPITTNAAIAPDGTLSANKMTPDTTSGRHRVKQGITITSGNTYTHSLYCKPAGYNFLEVGFYISQVGEYSTATVNLTDGSFTELITGTSFTNVSVIVKKVNDYFKITVTATIADVTADAYIRINDGSGTIFVGDGVSGVYVWGSQFEAQPFATSYISTEGAAVSRSSDNLSLPASGNMPPHNKEFTLNIDFAINGLPSGNAYLYDNGIDGGVVRFSRLSSTGTTVAADGSSSGTVITNPATINEKINHIITREYNNTVTTWYLNKVEKGGITIAPSSNNWPSFSVGSTKTFSQHINGHISKLSTYAQALTAQEITLL